MGSDDDLEVGTNPKKLTRKEKRKLNQEAFRRARAERYSKTKVGEEVVHQIGTKLVARVFDGDDFRFAGRKPREKSDLKTLFVEDLSDPKVFRLVYPALKAAYEVISHPSERHVPDDHPDRNQLGFHKSAAMYRIIFGGNHSGKTRTISKEIEWTARRKHPYRKIPDRPIRIWVISASYANIQNGVWDDLNELIPKWEIESYGQTVPQFSLPNRIRLKNGSEIFFHSGFGSKTARRKLQTAEIDIAAVDEEVDDILIDELKARLLARNGSFIASATAVESVDWLLDLEERAERLDPNVELFRFKTIRAVEAGHISRSVYNDLAASFSGEEREVRLEGKTRRRQGLVFPEFTTGHVCQPFEIPRTWARYMAIDPGWGTFACLWAAVSPDGRVYLYRELYEHAARLDMVVDLIRSSEGYRRNEAWHEDEGSGYESKWLYEDGKTEVIDQRLIDPANFGVNPGGTLQVGHMLPQVFGIHVAPAMNDVEYGIEATRRLLSRRDLVEEPIFKVFSSLECFLYERARYRRRPISDKGWKNDGKPIKKKDHLMDCWRYLVTGGLEPGSPRGRSPEDTDYLLALSGIPVSTIRSGLARPDLEKGVITHSSGLGTEF